MRPLPLSRGVRRAIARSRAESGSMLIELLITMTFISVAIGALLAVYASTTISLRNSSISGNATTLVDTQMETFKTLPYAAIAIDQTTVPGGSDAYVTTPPTNLTTGQQAAISTGQRVGGTYAATQTLTGPDGRSYRVDTYAFPLTPTGGQGGVQITVAARSITAGTLGPIRAQVTSAFDIATTRQAT